LELGIPGIGIPLTPFQQKQQQTSFEKIDEVENSELYTVNRIEIE